MPRIKKSMASRLNEMIASHTQEFQSALAAKVNEFVKTVVAESFGLDTGDTLIEKHVASLIEEAKTGGRKRAVRRKKRGTKEPVQAAASKTRKPRAKKASTKKAAVKAARVIVKKARGTKAAAPKTPKAAKATTANGANSAYAALKQKVLSQAEA